MSIKATKRADVTHRPRPVLGAHTRVRPAPDQAAAAYVQYIQDTEEQGISDRDDQIAAFRYLAKYYNKQERLDEAYDYAMRCTEFSDSRDEDKALLREISSKRGAGVPGYQDQVTSEPSHSVITNRLRPNIVVSSPTPRRDFEPINLNFTP